MPATSTHFVLSQRNITLLGSNLAFFSVAALLYLRQPWAAALFPCFASIFYWSDFRRDEEIHVIFLFMIAVAALLLLSQSRDNGLRLALAGEALAVLLISLGLGAHRGRVAQERQRVLARLQELDADVRDGERDLRFYGAFEDAAATQIQMRRSLVEAARHLGGSLDSEEVQGRLVRLLERRYPESRVLLSPGQPPDALVRWVVETRASLLVKDAQADERFAAENFGFRSAVVSPLWVMKEPFGFLMVEDPRPGVFRSDDLRTVDLFSMLASLSLENIRFLAHVNDLATHDALTQLFTHRAFQERLQEEVLRAGRGQMPLSLILCDVDHFKRYNDGYGHQAGDGLLRALAGLLAANARPVDFPARYGGEEFALILPGLAREQAAELAERVRQRVESEPFLFEGRRTGVTLSLGVSAFPQDATTPSQLVRAADERLYKAKQGGRNRVIAA